MYGKERKAPHRGYLLYPALGTKVGRVVLSRIDTLGSYILTLPYPGKLHICPYIHMEKCLASRFNKGIFKITICLLFVSF